MNNVYCQYMKQLTLIISVMFIVTITYARVLSPEDMRNIKSQSESLFLSKEEMKDLKGGLYFRACNDISYCYRPCHTYGLLGGYAVLRPVKHPVCGWTWVWWSECADNVSHLCGWLYVYADQYCHSEWMLKYKKYQDGC